jgi:hypothetical protein
MICMTIMVLFAIIYQVIVPDDSTDSTTNNTNAGVICDNIAHHCTAIHESMVKRVIQRTEQYSTNKLCALRNKNVNNISRTLAQFKHETRQIVHTTSLTACTPCTLSTFIKYCSSCSRPCTSIITGRLHGIQYL